jgi:hypothetical protein
MRQGPYKSTKKGLPYKKNHSQRPDTGIHFFRPSNLKPPLAIIFCNETININT